MSENENICKQKSGSAASLLLTEGHVTKDNGTSHDFAWTRSLPKGAGVSWFYGGMILDVSVCFLLIYGQFTVVGSSKHL